MGAIGEGICEKVSLAIATTSSSRKSYKFRKIIHSMIYIRFVWGNDTPSRIRDFNTLHPERPDPQSIHLAKTELQLVSPHLGPYRLQVLSKHLNSITCLAWVRDA